MRNELNFSEKTVLITGGGTGLGLGIAKEFYELDAHVILAGRREDVLGDACASLGERASYAVLDISDHNAVPAKVAALYETCGTIDVLVNNAGIQNNKNALDYSAEEFTALFDTNVIGTYVLTREIAARMKETGKGSIVFITSSAVHMGLTRNLPYSGTKGALSSMVRAFASELSPCGIRVNGVAPGWIETELVKESLRRVPERREMVMRRSMLGRLGTPEDIGRAVAFLASDAASFITAAELRVDGGISVSL